MEEVGDGIRLPVFVPPAEERPAAPSHFPPLLQSAGGKGKWGWAGGWLFGVGLSPFPFLFLPFAPSRPVHLVRGRGGRKEEEAG
jgi:hypothetical protein